MMAGRVYFNSTETYVFDSAGRLIKAWFACYSCGKIHESRKSAEACCNPNAVVSERYHVCMACGSVFTSADAFEDHRDRGCVKVVNEAKNTRELHACLSCGATLTSKTALESHLQWHATGARETKVVFMQEGRVVGAAFMTGEPRLRFTAEALIGYEDGMHLVSCDRCGAVVGLKEIISIFHGPRGEKVDYCKSCATRVIR